MWKRDAAAVVVLGGDGTCRDVASGWPDAPLIAISTGTNNVYPSPIDGTSAGVAAGLIASARVCIDRVAVPSKRITVHLDGREPIDTVALVDLALVDNAFVGARAVRDPESIRVLVAAIGSPVSTGLSSIAGRIHPIDRNEAGGVLIRFWPEQAPLRRIRVPLSPGTFDTLDIAEIEPIADGQSVQFTGPGVLAFDGERDLPIGRDDTVTAIIDRTGPRLIDVATTIHLATADRAFDVQETPDAH
jgi:hypothetical protein